MTDFILKQTYWKQIPFTDLTPVGEIHIFFKWSASDNSGEFSSSKSFQICSKSNGTISFLGILLLE